jgi:hypothetical protein
MLLWHVSSCHSVLLGMVVAGSWMATVWGQMALVQKAWMQMAWVWMELVLKVWEQLAR